MRVHKNELYISRGETFTIRKKIVNRNGSPYIISSKLQNPYWLITVSDSELFSKNQYRLNKWLNLKVFPRFQITTPVDFRSISDEYDSFETVSIPHNYEGETGFKYANKAVFYLKNDDGTIDYKYFVYDRIYDGTGKTTKGHWEDYECYIDSTFSGTITSEWTEQNYYYSIYLVSGESTESYVKVIATKLGIDDSGSAEEIYERIVNSGNEKYVADINISAPIVFRDFNRPILIPTKMYVTSNLNGGSL